MMPKKLHRFEQQVSLSSAASFFQYAHTKNKVGEELLPSMSYPTRGSAAIPIDDQTNILLMVFYFLTGHFLYIFSNF
jgi:hypothetical protein